MAVPAVASAVNHAFLRIRRYLKLAGLILVKCPEMVLLVKVSLASRPAKADIFDSRTPSFFCIPRHSDEKGCRGL